MSVRKAVAIATMTGLAWLLLTLGVLAVVYPPVGVSVPGVAVSEPEEDEPGFDCRIHRNKMCGGVSSNG